MTLREEEPSARPVEPLQPEEYRSAGGVAHRLRPLSTGELLDRTFAIYRADFWLFAGLAALVGIFNLILNCLQLLIHRLVLVEHGLRMAALEAQIASLVMVLLVLPVYAVVQAGSVYALCGEYRGRGVTAGAALQATSGGWLRYVGIGLWQGWSTVWLFVLLVGAVLLTVIPGMELSGKQVGLGLLVALVGGGGYGLIAYIRNSLAIPVALMEGTGVRASMRRSKTLAVGTKGRIFVVLLIAGVLYLVGGVIDAPMIFFIARTPREEHLLAQVFLLLMRFTAHMLVSPVVLIGLTLVYLDQRMWLEAADLTGMMGAALGESEPGGVSAGGAGPEP